MYDEVWSTNVNLTEIFHCGPALPMYTHDKGVTNKAHTQSPVAQRKQDMCQFKVRSATGKIERENQKHPLLQSWDQPAPPLIKILPPPCHPQYFSYQLPCMGRAGLFLPKMVEIFQPSIILPILLLALAEGHQQVQIKQKPTNRKCVSLSGGHCCH